MTGAQRAAYTMAAAVVAATGCNNASIGAGDDSAVFVQRDGLVSMEAEHFQNSARPGTTAWKGTDELGEPSGETAMQALPNKGAQFDQKYTGVAARLDYEVTFETTGTHYVWVRGWAPGAQSATVHVGIDGEETETSDRMEGFAVGAWTWSKATLDDEPATVEVSGSAEHTINVWMRQDGFAFDKIVLTNDAEFVPQGAGPPETREDGPISPNDGGSATADGGEGDGGLDPGRDAGEQRDAGTDAGMLPTLTYEAEEMDLETYVVDPNDDMVIRIPDGSTTGTATVMSFEGPDGEYAVRTHIRAEGDGQPSLEMRVGETTVYEETYPASDMGMEDVELGPHTASLSNGDTIELIGTQDMSAWARVDKIVLGPPE